MLTRRELSGGACAAFLSGRVRAEDQKTLKKPVEFRPYRPGKSLCPITCITPDDGFYIHTFFDVCPWSPSQRYLACLRIPTQERPPEWRDKADVCIIDLKDRTIQTVYSTSAFGLQTGAQVQWGRSDRFLYFNDKTGRAKGQATGIRLDWQSGKAEELAGPVYSVSSDESAAISFSLDLINHTQEGYGCAIAPERRLRLSSRAARDQGLWYTDLKTNRTRLLVSLAQIYEAMPDKDAHQGLDFYLFHSKFNPQGTRIIQVVRLRDPKQEMPGYSYPLLTTFHRDGSDIRIAIPWQKWSLGGNHPNWLPDGERLLINLKIDKVMRLCVARYDGSDFHLVSKTLLGSGHPSFEKTMRYIFTDAYPKEPMTLPNGEVPLRLIDTRADQETTVATIYTLGRQEQNILRLDPHPAWSRDGKQVCFNGAPDGRRQLFIADVGKVLGGTEIAHAT
jgi:hypothetical protein